MIEAMSVADGFSSRAANNTNNNTTGAKAFSIWMNDWAAIYEGDSISYSILKNFNVYSVQELHHPYLLPWAHYAVMRKKILDDSDINPLDKVVRAVDLRLTFRSKDEFYKTDPDSESATRRAIHALGNTARSLSSTIVDKFFRESVVITIHTRNIGSAFYTVYTCDFTREYIDINADYRN